MPVPSEDGIADIVVVKQSSAEEADPSFPPPMKHRDTRDSISSVDSDISLSYDSSSRRDSAELPEILPDLGEDSGSESSTGGKDSGCDNEAEDSEKKKEVDDEPPASQTVAEASAPADEDDGTPFEPPDDDLAARIVAQVEFYFSDVNITKDAFLLKHVKRNKEGYVSLKLISSFKRVKHLAKDWRVVAYALEGSTKLQVNEAKTKLRRVDPLPQYDETTPSRTVAVLDLPLERPTIENVAELFSPCGEIALVRILRPGNPVPADARPFVAKHPELSTSVCALVEFERTECAKRAVKEAEESRSASGGGGMRVLELTKASASSKKAAAKKAAEAKKEQQIQLLQQQIQQLQQITRPQLAQINGKKKTTRANARPSFVADAVLSGATQETEEKMMSEPARRRWSGPLERFQQRRPSSGLSCGGSPLIPRHKGSIGSCDQANSPWVQRRIAAAAETVAECGSQGSESPPCRSRSNSAAFRGSLLLPENVVRMPRGPDGSKGFRCGLREMLLSKKVAAEGGAAADSPSADATCALAC